MRFNSLLSKITLIFVVAFLLLVGHFIAFIKFEDRGKYRQVFHSHQNLSKYFKRNHFSKSEVIEYVKDFDFELEPNHREVLENGKRLPFSRRGFETIIYKGEYYFHVTAPHFRILFKDLNYYESHTSYGFLVFLSILLLLVGIYIWLLRSLKPLYVLKEQITQFAQGDLNINCKSTKKDEIADVANEFDNVVSHIKLLLNSRQLFLRTVMHELKTPIAKGRIVSELIDNEKQKERMTHIFEKLDFLINDFAKIEQVVSKNYEVYKSEFSLKTIFNHAISMLILDERDERIVLPQNLDKKLNVDVELMAMVFKNLIDNAFKYSKDGKVVVFFEDDCLIFSSLGEPLEKELDAYFKPFHNDTTTKNHGMGLGLYIVKSILDLHGFGFEYKYNENINAFKILF